MKTHQEMCESGEIHGSQYDRRKSIGADVKEVLDYLIDDLPSEQWEMLPQYMQDKIMAVQAKYLPTKG